MKEIITFIKNAGLTEVARDRIKNQRRIDTQAAITALMLSDWQSLESKGVYVNYEFAVETQNLICVYIGLHGAGVVAAYYGCNQEWHECQSNGNFGKNYASGGTWSVIKKTKSVPDIVKSIIKNI